MENQNQGSRIQANIDSLVQSLSNEKTTKIIAKISEFYDDDSRIFVFDFEPLIPVLGESETMENAQKQALAALHFFFSKEAEARNIPIDLNNLIVEFQVVF